MKLLPSIIALIVLFGMWSCSGGDKSPSAASTPSAVPAPTAVNTGTVEHYTCPNGHVGSGSSSAGTCAQCGATLEHNAAFHNSPTPNEPAANADPVANQNVNSGVEHYICPNGHIGSGGPSAGTCGQCGATLDHNTAYHNDPPPSDLVNQVNNINPPSGDGSTPNPAVTSAPTVEHYVCPNGHVGFGGPSEGVCSQCSATLQHNDAFHSNDPVSNTAVPTAPQMEQITPQPMDAVPEVFRNNPVNAGGISPGVGGAEPAQNSRGIWHYVCSNGCGGGAGSAVACSTCGNTLVHNDLYHN